ncbi:hypothetical protein F511_31676 [Dorcoceras hygrometricum]|uniref:Uncharacterized protein n=1 Tax=Dorcoceras hygrometricum TaxID=472368 RepID=A0A2Z7CBK3_9LAMI|nr:hypothetical protein F511_31676 [Dorcoceras hygrometricum]
MVAFRPALCARQRRIKHAMAGRNLAPSLSNQAAVDPPIRSTTGINLPPSICTRRLDGFYHGWNLLSTMIGASPITGRRRVVARTATRGREGGEVEGRPRLRSWRLGVSMTFRVVRTNQYNQDLGLIHSTNGNHLKSSNEGSSIDHQVTIHLNAQNITMFPTNETWYFTSQMLVSSSGCLILILTAQ